MFEIQRYYDVLSVDDNIECYDRLVNGYWNFGEFSNKVDKVRFWIMQLAEDDFFTSYFFNRICDLTKRKFKLKKVYANGQTYGQPGSLHTDSTGEGREFTFLYYVNPEWNVTWSGGTVFWVSENQHKTENFIPNSAILFDANIIHAGLEPSRHFYGLRITVAFKMVEIT